MTNRSPQYTFLLDAVNKQYNVITWPTGDVVTSFKYKTELQRGEAYTKANNKARELNGKSK